MSSSNFKLLQHISDEISFILDATSNKGKDAVFNDPVLSRAIVRSLEIIGEASNKLDLEFKAEHSAIEWRKIVNTRHKLIHNYFGIDYDIVWDIITNKLPDLFNYVEQIIKK